MDDFYTEATETVRNNWGSDGNKVIELCGRVTPFNGSFGEFLTACDDSADDWCEQWISGIKRIAPDVANAIPEDMGRHAWYTVACVLILLGVRTWER